MKKQQAQQVLSSARPTDFVDIPYSSALLLEARFDSSITDDPEFHSSCEWGFDSYFEGQMRSGCVEVVYEDRFYNRGEVCRELVDNVVVAHRRDKTPLVTCVGVALGWLSALALAQYQEAQEGLQNLMGLLEREQQSSRWSTSASRSVDSAGWPLDM